MAQASWCSERLPVALRGEAKAGCPGKQRGATGRPSERHLIPLQILDQATPVCAQPFVAPSRKSASPSAPARCDLRADRRFDVCSAGSKAPRESTGLLHLMVADEPWADVQRLKLAASSRVPTWTNGHAGLHLVILPSRNLSSQSTKRSMRTSVADRVRALPQTVESQLQWKQTPS